MFDPYSGYNFTPNFQLGTTGAFTPQPGMFAGGLSPSVRLNQAAQQALGGQPGATGNVDLTGLQRSRRQQASQMASDAVQSVLGGLQGAATTAKGVAQRVGAQIPPSAGAYARTGLGIAAAIPAAVAAAGEIQEGRPTGALAALAPAGLSMVGARLLGKGPVGTAAGLGLMGLGAILPGATASAAESVRQKVTGEPTKGKEGEFSTQMAMNRQLAELGVSQYRDQMGVYTSNIKDLSKFYADQDYYNLQRNMPLINQLKNADLTRQQALINTQGQNYAMLGALATAGQLATGAQAEAGANLRTALTSNPYAGSVLQAPSISYGR